MAFDQHAISNRAHSTTLTPLLKVFPRVRMRLIRILERCFRAAEVRTRDLLHPMQARYQLRYGPFFYKPLNLCILIRLASFFWILFYACYGGIRFSLVRRATIFIAGLGNFLAPYIVAFVERLVAHSRKSAHFNGLQSVGGLARLPGGLFGGSTAGKISYSARDIRNEMGDLSNLPEHI